MLALEKDFFLETNSSTEVSNSLLWETLKAYLRGQIISHCSKTHKAKNKRLNDILLTSMNSTHPPLPHRCLKKDYDYRLNMTY